MRGETAPQSTASPEALPVESLAHSSRGMGKLLRTRNLHVELQRESSLANNRCDLPHK